MNVKEKYRVYRRVRENQEIRMNGIGGDYD